jgi:hypothetical protein
MQGFYRNHMEEVIKFFETHHKVATHSVIFVVIVFLYLFFDFHMTSIPFFFCIKYCNMVAPFDI